ncbi:MAG: DUF2213 domain-containing protein [Acetobacter sp.]|jgi:hypothetical protein
MTDHMALDQSVRRIDEDGHLHVERCIISAAVVSPYYGREIPGSEALKLKPDEIYWLYRDADALREAASSMNGKPIIEVHKPINAEDHPKEITVGSVNNVRFEDPDLIGELAIWDGDAVKRIQDNSKRCVSAGYAYTAIPEDGEVNGQKYTLKMVNIRFNHLALVENPRVQTAIIGDSAIITMENGSMAVHKPMTAVGRVLAALKSGRLGMDASEEDVKKCMDEEETEEEKKAREEAEKKAADEAAEEEAKKKKAEDEEAEAKAREQETAQDQAIRKAVDAAISVQKQASDAALAQAIENLKSTTKQAQDAREAVRPLVGDVVGLDSAPDIYRYALKSIGVDASSVHPSALPAMVSMATSARHSAPRVAMDAAPDKDSPLAGLSARRRA